MTLFQSWGKNIFLKVYLVLKKIASFLQTCKGKKWQMQPGLSLEALFLIFDMGRMSVVS